MSDTSLCSVFLTTQNPSFRIDLSLGAFFDFGAGISECCLDVLAVLEHIGQCSLQDRVSNRVVLVNVDWFDLLGCGLPEGAGFLTAEEFDGFVEGLVAPGAVEGWEATVGFEDGDLLGFVHGQVLDDFPGFSLVLGLNWNRVEAAAP